MRIVFAAVTALLLALPAAAQQTVFVVRHAERADTGTAGSSMMAKDPDLSAAGKARADSLAAALKDAGITAIYTSEFKRTQQTAAPLARALGLTPVAVPASDLQALMEKVKKGGNALVVGHSNSVGPILAGLGVSTPIKLADDEYDNLFVVVAGEKPTLVRLHFR